MWNLLLITENKQRLDQNVFLKCCYSFQTLQEPIDYDRDMKAHIYNLKVASRLNQRAMQLAAWWGKKK